MNDIKVSMWSNFILGYFIGYAKPFNRFSVRALSKISITFDRIDVRDWLITR